MEGEPLVVELISQGRDWVAVLVPAVASLMTSVVAILVVVMSNRNARRVAAASTEIAAGLAEKGWDQQREEAKVEREADRALAEAQWKSQRQLERDRFLRGEKRHVYGRVIAAQTEAALQAFEMVELLSSPFLDAEEKAIAAREVMEAKVDDITFTVTEALLIGSDEFVDLAKEAQQLWSAFFYEETAGGTRPPETGEWATATKQKNLELIQAASSELRKEA